MQTAFEDLSNRRDSVASLSNIFQCCHPHSEEVLPAVEGELLVLQFASISSCPGTEHYCEEPGSIFFTTSLQLFTDIDEIPLSFLFPRLNHSSSLSLSSQKCSGRFIVFVALCWTTFLCPCLPWGEGTELDMVLQVQPHLHRVEGKDNIS